MQDREAPLQRVALRALRRVATYCNSTIDPSSSTDTSCQQPGFAVLSKLPIERLTRAPNGESKLAAGPANPVEQLNPVSSCAGQRLT